MHPQPPDGGGASRACDEDAEDRLRLQHRADVASAAAGRGFRHRRHPDQGPHHVRRRPRLSHPRGRDLRRADARPGTPTASCSRSRSRSSSRRSTTSASRTRASTTRCRREVPYRGYELKELTLVPRPIHLPVEMLAADRQRQPARARLHGQARHQGRGRRRRGDDGAAGRSSPIRMRPRAPARNLKLGENLMIGIFFHLARPREQAIREITPLYEEHVKMFAPLGFVPGHDGGADRGGGAARRLGRGRRADGRALHEARRLVRRHAGGAGRASEGPRGALSRHASTSTCSTSIGTPQPVMLEQFQWVAEAVMPAFKR